MIGEQQQYNMYDFVAIKPSERRLEANNSFAMLVEHASIHRETYSMDRHNPDERDLQNQRLHTVDSFYESAMY